MSSSIQTLIKEANSAFSKKQWQSAADKFGQIRQEQTSPELEANLGQSYLELSQTGLGIYHLNQASLMDRFNKRIKKDLDLAKEKVANNAGKDMSHPTEYAYQIYKNIRPSESFSVALFFVLIFLTVTFFSIKSKLLNGLLIFLSGIFLFAALFALSAKNVAVSLPKESPVYALPSLSATKTHTMPSGTRLRIIKESGNYIEVERSSFFRGWVEKTALQKLIPFQTFSKD